MSASTERKNRHAAREAGTDKKMLATQEAAAKAAVSRRRWIIGTIAVFLCIILIIVFSSPAVYRFTRAETIGTKTWSPAELHYTMGTSYYTTYANYFGEDYAKAMLENSLTSTAALLQYAEENGLQLIPAEKEAADKAMESLPEVAKSYGVGVNAYLTGMYGNGVNKSVVRRGMLESILINKANFVKTCELSFTDEELDAYYDSTEGTYDNYHYAVYQVAVDEQLPDEEAKATAAAIAMSFQDGREEDMDPLVCLNDILAEEFPPVVHPDTDEAPTPAAAEEKTESGTSLDSAYREWLMDDARQNGDIYVAQSSANDGYFVVLFLDRDDNSDTVASVRHILIKAVADENGVYTEEAKAAAKARCEELLEAWKVAGSSEADFATLAMLWSEDTGSTENGGLYYDVRPGQMVEEFDRFCFEPHSHGDTAIVYGESGAYAGYHIIYFVGSESARHAMARNDLTGKAITEWMSTITEGLTPEYHWGYKLVG